MKNEVCKKLMAIGLSALMLAGCGAKGADKTTEVKKKDASAVDTDVEKREYKDVKITIYTRMDTSTEKGKWFVKVLEDFQKEYPGIRVENIMTPTESDYLDGEAVMMSDPASMPNILEEYGGSRVLDYIHAGNLVCTQPYFDADKEWFDSFNTVGWGLSDFSDYGIEGYYGVPQNGYFISLYYNEDILKENNVDPKAIKSWDDLMAACKTLKDKGVQPFEIGEKDNYRFGHLHSVLNYKSYGGEVAAKLGKDEMSYDGKEQLAVYQKIIDAYKAGYLGKDLLGLDDGQEKELFNAGKTAFLFMGSWYCAEAGSGNNDLYNNKKIHTISFPYVDEKYAFSDMGGGNECYYVTDTGNDDEIAASVLLLKYMTSREKTDELVKKYPEISCVNPSVEMDNYLLNEVMELMKNSKDIKGDIENYDTAAHMINTVRNALQSIPTGASAEDVGKNIVETSKQYEG